MDRYASLRAHPHRRRPSARGVAPPAALPTGPGAVVAPGAGQQYPDLPHPRAGGLPVLFVVSLPSGVRPCRAASVGALVPCPAFDVFVHFCSPWLYSFCSPFSMEGFRCLRSLSHHATLPPSAPAWQIGRRCPGRPQSPTASYTGRCDRNLTCEKCGRLHCSSHDWSLLSRSLLSLVKGSSRNGLSDSSSSTPPKNCPLLLSRRGFLGSPSACGLRLVRLRLPCGAASAPN